MKSAVIFTATGPILILTTHDSLDDPDLIEKLRDKGITKYIAHEVPLNKVKERYGTHYSIVVGDLSQTDDLRVLDYDGRHIFNTFDFDQLRGPVYHDEPRKAA